jgi:hypothetical protein
VRLTTRHPRRLPRRTVVVGHVDGQCVHLGRRRTRLPLHGNGNREPPGTARLWSSSAGVNRTAISGSAVFAEVCPDRNVHRLLISVEMSAPVDAVCSSW